MKYSLVGRILYLVPKVFLNEINNKMAITLETKQNKNTEIDIFIFYWESQQH